MKCDEMNELMPDLAVGSLEPSVEIRNHLESCAACAQTLAEFRQTMVLLDEWQVPEPSPYFDTRLNARLREEATKEEARQGWLGWLRRPAAVALATVLIAAGIGIVSINNRHKSVRIGGEAVAVSQQGTGTPASEAKGTAVGDLQALDKDPDLYADFDVLDDLDNNQNQRVNP